VGAADEAMQQRAREERQRVDELRAELQQLTAQESRLPPEVEKLSQQLSQGRTLVAQREANCGASLSSKEQKLAELDKGCALYRSRLGLHFERVGDERLRLTFTNIDASNPLRPFAFQVFVDGGDKYHVRSTRHTPRPLAAEQPAHGCATPQRFRRPQLCSAPHRSARRNHVQRGAAADASVAHPTDNAHGGRCRDAARARPTLRVLCDRAQVESCEPAVSGMGELVTQLNTNNDFAAFVRAMRKRFKALA
jgi:hypothetical protein